MPNAGMLASLRTALELDRFGLVAHVVGDQGCTSDGCDALMRFHDSSKVLAHLRDHTFEEHVKKYTAIWDRPADGVATTVDPPVALPSATGRGSARTTTSRLRNRFRRSASRRPRGSRRAKRRRRSPLM
jgi:hypothetical protein